MRRSENRLVFGTIALFATIVAIGFVYAGFTGTLNVNGTGNVTASKWDIYFANLSNAVTTGQANVIEPATIQSKTRIGDYLVEFDELGDSLTYTFDVVNDGNFDAVLTVLTITPPQCSGGDATSNQAACNNLEYTLKYTANNRSVAQNDILRTGETKNMTLKLQVKSNGSLSGITRDVEIGGLGITMMYSQDSGYGGNPVIPAITFVNRRNANQITVGDEVAIDTEHFYVVSSDANETVLLAKYNLLVGDVFDVDLNNYTLNKTLTSSDTGYGLQNSTARGLVNEANQYIGTVAFSGTNYWDNLVCQSTGTSYGCTGENGLSSGYSGNYHPIGNPLPEIYRSNMSSTAPSLVYGTSGTNGGSGYAQNNGYTIAYYVEAYVNQLKTNQNVPSSIEGRLLTYEEAIELERGTATYTVNQSVCENYFKQNWSCQDDNECNNNVEQLCLTGSDDWGDNLEEFIVNEWILPSDYEAAGLSNVSVFISAAGEHLYDSSYWLGSACEGHDVWRVGSDGTFHSDYFYDDLRCGVRPVIVVSTSDI